MTVIQNKGTQQCNLKNGRKMKSLSFLVPVQRFVNYCFYVGLTQYDNRLIFSPLSHKRNNILLCIGGNIWNKNSGEYSSYILLYLLFKSLILIDCFLINIWSVIILKNPCQDLKNEVPSVLWNVHRKTF